MRALRDWTQATVNLYASNPGTHKSEQSVKAARDSLTSLAKIAGERLRPLQLTPIWDIHRNSVYDWVRNSTWYTECFRSAHVNYLGQISYTAFKVSSVI